MSVFYHRRELGENAGSSHSTVITSEATERPFLFNTKRELDRSTEKMGSDVNNEGSASIFTSIFESAKAWFHWIEPTEAIMVSTDNGIGKRELDTNRNGSNSRKKFHLDSRLIEEESLRQQLENSITPKKQILKLPKDPFKWDDQPLTEEGVSDSPTRVQYGTRLYRRHKNKSRGENERALTTKQSQEVSYLQMVFNGEYQLPEPVRREQEHQLLLLSRDRDDSKLDRGRHSIINLTERIKALLLESRKKIGATDRDDTETDLIFIKERKVDPLEERKKQFYDKALKFDRSLISFQEEFKSYEQLIEERRKIVEEVRKREQTKKALVPRLSEDQAGLVKSVFNRSDNSVLCDKFMIEVTVRDFKTLAPGRWLNDTIIEFFMKYIESNTAKVVAFNSFFYSTLADRGYQGVRRWMKRKKAAINDLDIIFAPVNLNQAHWALSIIDLRNRKILYVDSLSSGLTSTAFAIMKDLQSYVIEESKGDLGEDFELCHLECPRQTNGFDCGIYVCLNTLYYSKGCSPTFTHKDASAMRLYIGYLILSKE